MLERADTVVWLDLPRRVWLPRLVRRTLRRVVRREELWNGNRESLRGVLVGPGRCSSPYALRNERPRRQRYPRELARFRVARLRSQAEVDAFLRARDVGCGDRRRDAARPRRATTRQRAAKTRAKLRHPRGRAEPEPDGGQHDVEEDHRHGERRPPDDPEADRHPPLLREVAADPAGEGPVLRVAGRHADAVSRRRWRSATSRMMRIAVSSTESSETSITGQRSLRWIRAAASSSSNTTSRSA